MMHDMRSFAIAGHIITPMRDPALRLSAVLELIASAQQRVEMFSYMFSDDRTGQEVLNALIAAQNRGVQVELMIDSFGSGDIKDSFFAPLVALGGVYRCFSSRWRIDYFIRNHQKILVVDRSQAIIGGFNITDNYFGRKGADSWEDFGIVIKGQAAASLSDYYAQLVEVTGEQGVRFRSMRKMILDWRGQSGPLQILIGGPTKFTSPWARQFKRDLQNASSVDIVSAYFSPTRGILRRLVGRTRKGNGRSRILLAGRTDNKATIPAARSLYRYLMRRGAEVFEYQPRPLHMKLMIIDDAAYVGSANLDVRSLFINLEIMIRIENAEFADHLRQMIGDMCAESEQQTAALHAQRSGIFKRFWQGLAYLLVNSVDYTIGRRIKFSLLDKD